MSDRYGPPDTAAVIGVLEDVSLIIKPGTPDSEFYTEVFTRPMDAAALVAEFRALESVAVAARTLVGWLQEWDADEAFAVPHEPLADALDALTTTTARPSSPG